MKKTLFVAATALVLAVTGASAQNLLTEAFAYPDGNLAGNGPWTAYSSAGTGPLQVTGGAAIVNGTLAEDDTAAVSAAALTSGIIDVSFTLTLSAAPTGAGTYFFLLKDTGTSNFRARTYATTTGAAAGSFRLGISNAAATANAVIPVDLTVGTTYTLALSYNAATAVSTLTVAGSTVTAADTTTVIGITNVALRQSTGEGTIAIDNLSVNYTAVPEPATYAYIVGGLGALALGVRRRSA